MLETVPPELDALDETEADALAFGIFDDVRPFRGLADLVDWRMAGRLSRLATEAFVQGSWLEPVLMPGKPELPFGKIVVVGLGSSTEFDEARARESTEFLRRVLEGLGVAHAVVELPGRATDALRPEIGVSIALATFGPSSSGAPTSGTDRGTMTVRLFDGARAKELLRAHADAERMRRRIP
ncbi:MAG: M17 family peptidase N-terminal domain-containing protein [Polyangiaceae bacterium]